MAYESTSRSTPERTSRPGDPLVHPEPRADQQIRTAGPMADRGATAPRSDASFEHSRRFAHSDDDAYGHSVSNARHDDDSAAIQRDIDQTRSRMDRTVADLAERLRPASLLGDVLDYFASDTGARTSSANQEKLKRAARRAGSSTWDKIKANPIPSALIGAGVAYMFIKGDDDEAEYRGYSPGSYRAARRSAEPPMYGGSYVDARTGEPYDMEHYGDEMATDQRGGSREGMTGKARRYAGDAAEGAKHAAQGAGHAAGSAASSMGHAASSAAHTIGDAASRGMHSIGSAMRGLGHSASSGAGHVGHAAGSGSRAAWSASRARADAAWRRSARMSRHGYAYSRDRFNHALEEQPLAVGVAALAAGILAGLCIPRTRSEDRLMGNYSHRLKGEAYDRGRRVMRTGMETARSEAERQGMSRDSLRAQASDLFEHAKDAAGRVASSAASALGDAARHVADDAKTEARDLGEDARNRGLTPDKLAESGKKIGKETVKATKDEATHQKEETRQEHGVS